MDWKKAVLAEDLDVRKTLFYATGAFVAIAIVSFLSFDAGMPLMLASFGASCVVLFGMPGSRPSRPRNVIGGHLIAAVVAVAVFAALNCTWYSTALAVFAAIVLMVLTDTVHPPGGATALFGVTSGASASYIVAPVLAGAVILVLVAYATTRLYNRCEKERRRGIPPLADACCIRTGGTAAEARAP